MAGVAADEPAGFREVDGTVQVLEDFLVADGLHIRRDLDACEFLAVFEYAFADDSYVSGDRHDGKVSAVFESSGSYRGYIICDDHRS